MENLDELMRKKFESDRPAERFEFREEYWEQAQALLEAEEKRRRKRRRWLLWWFFSGGMAVAVAVAVAGGSRQGAVGSGQSAGGSGQWTVDSGQWTVDSGQWTVGSGQRAVDSGQWAVDSGQWAVGEGRTSGVKEIREQRSDVVKDIAAGEKTPGTDLAVGNDPTGNRGAGVINEDRKAAVGPERRSGQDGEKTDIQRRAVSRNITPPPPAGKTKPELPAANQPDTGTEKNTSPRPGYEQVGRAPVSISPADTTATGIAAQHNPNDLNALSALPVLLQLLDLPERDLDTPVVELYVKPIKPRREQKFNFGLAAAGAINQASPDGRQFGAAGGVFAHYNFSASWSLTGGVQWRFLPGKWVSDTAPSKSVQLRYSFGYQQDEWRLETRGLHFIEAPVGLRWHRGAFAAEGGFAPGFLVGVQGRHTKQHAESLQESIKTEHSRGWLSKTPYYRFSPALFLGGEWRMIQQLGFTFRGAYRPGAFGEKLIPDEPPPVNLFWLDAGLRWYF